MTMNTLLSNFNLYIFYSPVFPASKLFEYQWPQESGPGGDWFFLQEQLSDFLDVKSFRRKFPGNYVQIMAINYSMNYIVSRIYNGESIILVSK